MSCAPLCPACVFFPMFFIYFCIILLCFIARISRLRNILNMFIARIKYFSVFLFKCASNRPKNAVWIYFFQFYLRVKFCLFTIVRAFENVWIIHCFVRGFRINRIAFMKNIKKKIKQIRPRVLFRTYTILKYFIMNNDNFLHKLVRLNLEYIWIIIRRFIRKLINTLTSMNNAPRFCMNNHCYLSYYINKK